MAAGWDSIDVHLLRVLQTLLTENSVSRAARKLNISQPAVSTALKRLRELTGDPLLVRSKNGMAPTERASAMLDPIRVTLEQIESMACPQGRFEPAQSRRAFAIGAPDFFNVQLAADILSRLRKGAPQALVVFHSMGPESDYAKALENGDLDVVIGNWPQPPANLRATSLFDDEMVVMMRAGHPLAARPMSADQYLDAEHLAPTPYSVGQRGVVDLFLAKERMKRKVTAMVPYFNVAPYLLLHSDLLFTAPARFARHYTAFLPVVAQAAPLDYPPIHYYLLWHDRQHYSAETRWFREQIVAVARASGD